MTAPDPEQWERAANLLDEKGVLPDQVAQFRDNATRERKQIEVGDAFRILSTGLMSAVICTSLSDDEAMALMTHSGTTGDWQVRTAMTDECGFAPDTHRHLYLEC